MKEIYSYPRCLVPRSILQEKIEKERIFIALKKDWIQRNVKVLSFLMEDLTITGALGFVFAIEELKIQLAEHNLNIDYIFFASSSGGMQAGLTLGIDLFDLNIKLIPINIDKDETNGIALEEVALNILKEGNKLFNLKKNYCIQDITLNKDYDKAGYGVVTDNEILAINTLAVNEGILMDPVYTGRAFYGMMDHLKNHKIAPKSNVLFWHTGGLPAIFKYADKIF